MGDRPYVECAIIGFCSVLFCFLGGFEVNILQMPKTRLSPTSTTTTNNTTQYRSTVTVTKKRDRDKTLSLNDGPLSRSAGDVTKSTIAAGSQEIKKDIVERKPNNNHTTKFQSIRINQFSWLSRSSSSDKPTAAERERER
mmetsp:Transcript_56633/g.137572  ORF Transcript_56633/g.137572 Transcript_56633/m.137572 type:complete len:140 (+) Transcript_56633:789-1208(+)